MARGPNSGISIMRAEVNADRFWSNVLVRAPDECWIWTGARNNKGYGQMNLPKYGRMVVTHRISYALTHGETPAGMCVMHACDTPACVNPAHLSVGTQAENLKDMWSKGRQRVPSGVFPQCEHGNARLNCNICCHVREGQRGAAFEQFFAHHCAPRLPETLAELAEATDERRALVFARVCGCFGFAAATGTAVALELGITRERVRQLRNDVMLRIGVAPEAIKQMPRGIMPFKEAAA